MVAVYLPPIGDSISEHAGFDSHILNADAGAD